MANKIKGITIEIGGDVLPLQKALRQVNKDSKNLQRELKGVNTLLKLDPKNKDLLGQKDFLQGKAIDETKRKLEALRETKAKVDREMANGTEHNAEQYRNLQREIASTESALKGLEKEAYRNKMGVDKLDAFSSKSKEVGKSMTRNVTLPILGIGVAAAKVGMDFEQSMSSVQAMSGANEEQMGRLEKAARDAGASTSKSAKDAADGLGYMALAGWDVETSIQGLMPVLRLSEAGNIDLARASSLVTDSMSAMGIEVQDLPKYLDIVAQTARSSNTDIDQMAEAYLGVGGTLRGLGVDLEESALALGFLANAGIKGSEAGTGLNAILLNMTAPTGRAKEALKDLGLTAFDSQGNFKGLENVLFELKDKTSGMTEEQKNMTLAMLGGKEHVKSLNALMNGLDDTYVDLKQNISEADGALEDVAKTMQANNKGSITELLSALEELALKIYDVLKPVIADLINFIQNLVDWLNNLSPGMQKTIVVIAGLAAAIGPVLVVLGTLAGSVSKIIMLFGPGGGLAGVLALLSGPVGIVLAIIAALIAIGVLLYKNWDKIKEGASKLVEGIKNSWNGIKEAIGKIVTTIIEAVTGLPKKMLEFGKNIIGGLIDGIKAKISGIKDVVGGIGKTVIGGVKNLFRIQSPSKVMEDMGENVGEGFVGGIGKTLGNIKSQTMAMSKSVNETISTSNINVGGAFEIKITGDGASRLNNDTQFVNKVKAAILSEIVQDNRRLPNRASIMPF